LTKKARLTRDKDDAGSEDGSQSEKGKSLEWHEDEGEEADVTEEEADDGRKKVAIFYKDEGVWRCAKCTFEFSCGECELCGVQHDVTARMRKHDEKVRFPFPPHLPLVLFCPP
jgi:hypothetical protein